ncbi:MAG: M15 family metallopeptidase [Prevotellaceae bacterium]|nr:M15 family metallopeptidase [Prevotellaceae bacterium]MCD8304254.1 M15 family metallopeptidase [Prevotellaceae bacterium]
MRAAIFALLLCLRMPLGLRAQDTCFVSLPVTDSIFQRMQGKSFPTGCTVSRSELRYLLLSYRDADGETRQGEMVCNKAIAADLVDIFRELWLGGYRIERMSLVDDYGADDQRSMAANNTSCFNFRYVSGTHTVSKHGRGMAVDVNPLYNPYVYTRGGKSGVEPQEGSPYATNRESRSDIPYKIDHNDLCYKLFRSRGFRWGGDWAHSKDYQHFEK